MSMIRKYKEPAGSGDKNHNYYMNPGHEYYILRIIKALSNLRKFYMLRTQQICCSNEPIKPHTTVIKLDRKEFRKMN